MAQTIKPAATGDTPKMVEDKVRALAANQGLNDYDMWLKVDAEIVAARSANTIREVVAYVPANKHGNK